MSMRIEDIATLIRGVSYKPDDLHSELDEGSVALLKNNNVNDDGSLSLDKVVYVDRTKVSSNQLLRPGDIIVCASGSDTLVGKAAQFNADGEYTFGAFCKVVRPHSVSKRYLGLFFMSPQYRSTISASAQGAIMKNLRNEHLLNLDIDYPELRLQEEIESKLDKLIGIIQRRKAQLKILDDLIKARFVEMFGDEANPYNWPVVNVEEVANVSVGVVIKPAQYYTDAEHGVKAFRSLNIGPMAIKDGDWVYFSHEGNEKNAKSQLKENDLLIVRSGAPGTACVVSKQYEGCNAIDIIIARPNTEQINPYYLCTYTNMPHGKRQIEEGTGGAAQQHFNVGKYNKLRLMLPPIGLQKEFVDFIAQVDKSKVAVQKSLDEIKVLFDSLMQQFFR